ncbi:MAG: pyridoxamine 5'-phosphate oxidase family protein [Gammaproteobacteria bacterium]|nr:pyridoxamine 5'-phosphate oxidase family protein [Gammaproteobacteria bacterium]
MAKQYPGITDELSAFIADQKIFFVGTAAERGRVNISPKGMDSLRVINENRVVWLNLTGSGNETSAHIQQINRMTIMFCSFSGKPVILRLYGGAREITSEDEEWRELYSLFSPIPGSRQIFDIDVDLVQTSCGMGVPLFDYSDDRDLLNDWARQKGKEGIKKYWEENNQLSIDGFQTNILKKNT